MITAIKDRFRGKKVCVLGYGREGQSSLKWIRNHLMDQVKSVTIADQNPAALHGEDLDACSCELRYGHDYLMGLDEYDLIIKSPGINLYKAQAHVDSNKLTSQSDLFLQVYGHRCIGITGTKGKSTTSSLLYEMLQKAGLDVLLLGNIGVPPLDAWEQISENTFVVFELSSHQLEHIKHAPQIAILLNLFQEHLDHYKDFRHYQLAKFNITLHQSPGSLLITHLDDNRIMRLLEETEHEVQTRYFSLLEHGRPGMFMKDRVIYMNDKEGKKKFAAYEDLVNLRGKHNVLNVMAAAQAAMYLGCAPEVLRVALHDFSGLKHRMEFIDKRCGIAFYNDAIATIPEATMAACEALPDVDTLILGGFDRGIDYDNLAQFLLSSEVNNLVFMGDAGERIYNLMKAAGKEIHANVLVTNNLSEAVEFAFQNTGRGRTCLLSPAASSYDHYKNFMEKGDAYRKLVLELPE